MGLTFKKIIRSPHTVHLRGVLRGSQNKQISVTYTKLTYCFFYNRIGICLLPATNWIFKPNSTYSEHLIRFSPVSIIPAMLHTHLYILLVPEEQKSETWKPSKQTMIFRKSGSIGSLNCSWILQQSICKCFVQLSAVSSPLENRICSFKSKGSSRTVFGRYPFRISAVASAIMLKILNGVR